MEDVIIVAAMAVGVGMITAKLLYIAVTYSFSDIWRWITTGDFTFLAEDGIVFYGGLLGGVLGAWIGARIAKRRLLSLEDAAVGCVLAGCCYGAPYEGFGAIHYAHSVSGLSSKQGYFPVQPLEAVGNVCICLLLLSLAKRSHRPGGLLTAYLCLYAVLRFCLEYLRGDSIRGIYANFSTSQWISLGVLAAGAAYLWLAGRRKAQPRTDT